MSSSSQNIAAVLETKFGSIKTITRPIPTPGPGNPVEWMVRDYGFGISEYPTVLGSDSSGIIKAVGPNVT